MTPKSMRIFWCVAVFALLQFNANVSAHDTNFWIFLCFGRSNMKGLPKTIPTAHVISSTGCEARRDRLHFAPAGYRELGKRYGEAMLSALGIKTTEEK